jgi:simple sugar transport system ATP-binding protein
MLSLHAVTKRFGSTIALDRADFSLRQGTVHALLGENGAGKTTLMRIAYGLTRADAGEVRFDGAPVRWRSPADALAAGLGMVQQHFALVPAMTVAENVALGLRGRFDPRAAADRVRRVSEGSGLRLDPDARVSELGVAAQQRTEIAKALARDARVLVLDEPTAVLAPDEGAELLRWLRAFAVRGGAVVLITHKLRDALGVADDVTVLRHGRTVLSASAAETSELALAEAMLGTVPDADDATAMGVTGRDGLVRARAPETGVQPKARIAVIETSRSGASVIVARNVTLRDAAGVVRIRDASFEIRAGEIVGVAAVEGSGQRELLRAIAGRMTPASGTLTIPDRAGFVPEDRHGDALVLEFTLVENVALHGLGARAGRMPWGAIRQRTSDLLDRYDVRAPGAEAAAAALSGGNQQKLVLARELAERPAALVVESPTRGLDIRASEAVHARLREARESGAAVVVHSPDLDEVLALADRVFVVHAGSVHETARDRTVVGRAMLGA